MRLLLVDDDTDTCELLGLFFTRQGCEVHAVGTVAAASSALASGHYDALLTDVELPDGNGRMLLAGGRPAGLRIAIVVSGHTGREELQASLRAGFDAHIGKPIDRQALTAMLGVARDDASLPGSHGSDSS